MWRRPPGVAPGTWQYVHQRPIADHYDAFVEDAAVCRVDAEILTKVLPGVSNSATKPETVLDLGCGTGRTAFPLAGRGYDVIGIDLSEPMLSVLVQKILVQRIQVQKIQVQTLQAQAAQTQKPSDASTPGHIFPVKANLVDLGGIADGTADHAVCLFATMGMIQGRANRQTVMQHVARIVRPGGKLVIHVHNRWAALAESGGYRYLTRSWLRSITKKDHDFGDATYAYRGLSEMFMHRFSRRELVTDLNACGWHVGEVLRLAIEADRFLGEFRNGGGVAGGFIVVATRK
ncbi:bifunctional 3-demethylubiquinone-9 3-methyltransferase/ 2-octaprenyl-6-hydroxy phenol methylase [Rubripirellula reticaptiva]|uniref:Bifunctional 3-demethylubiquinone-9 3-methyltransferase/ 2-octaprenyl-6-hydroxy phenol methylase n=2 Tax=Rubripirellula reticaptiva TaxID=2528013 RepID=A0A5C6FE81_9BACT|nr:bifunctional 3-demethylubiquinone-9 3-methyltransferase/ 2-octaprenyl-6-hydroxy phenol methylase [Rubripirellula reticaptiva]